MSVRNPSKPRRHQLAQRSILEAVEAYLADRAANDDDVLNLPVREHAWRLHQKREWVLLGQLLETLPKGAQDQLAEEIDQRLRQSR